MRKSKIESYIPTVMRVLNQKFPEGKAPSEYNGYISSFGASIIQSGLKATVALFENAQASTAQDKSCLTKIILEVLRENENQENNNVRLLNYILNSQASEDIIKEEIIAISIAIKLSLRTFRLEKGLNYEC